MTRQLHSLVSTVTGTSHRFPWTGPAAGVAVTTSTGSFRREGPSKRWTQKDDFGEAERGDEGVRRDLDPTCERGETGKGEEGGFVGF